MSAFSSRPLRRLMSFSRVISAILVLGWSTAVYAADESGATNETKEIQDLKQQLADQQKQIEELRMILLGQKKQIDSVSATAAAPPAATPAASAPASSAGPKSVPGDVASLAPIVPPLPAAPSPNAVVPPPQKESATAPSSPDTTTAPLTLKIGDTLITPIGFMDLTNTYRSTNAGTSLQTNFGSIPYNNGVTGRLSENKLSAANSRIGLRTDSLVHGWNVMGYFESDFVGGVSDTNYNTQVSSNSLILRIRQYYVTMRKNKFEFQAGQSWSMMTPNRVGISPLPQDLFYSQVVDVNYMNGLTWGRIPGVRFLYHPTEKVTFGLSLENSAQYFGGSGGGGLPTLPAALATAIAPE